MEMGFFRVRYGKENYLVPADKIANIRHKGDSYLVTDTDGDEGELVLDFEGASWRTAFVVVRKDG